MPRTSDGRMIRAVRAAHGLIRVAAKISGVDEAAIEKRVESPQRVAQEIAKTQVAVTDRAEFKFIEAAFVSGDKTSATALIPFQKERSTTGFVTSCGEPWAIRFLPTSRRSHRIPDAKCWSARLIELSELEIAELEQRLGIGYQTRNRLQSYPKATPKLPRKVPVFTSR